MKKTKLIAAMGIAVTSFFKQEGNSYQNEVY
ncbi:hypothetical protein SAMN05421796_11315 [Chryseobacterium piscicola]|uniref:Uncharacterized protein n=1 Tax=Chryseobacterium piscicola TaxID=551459 RepID=A0A1N7PE22_9FLAO|nr:hypothetical protein SAMN05421796_11315 [Chryseobacterium piscicola]